MIQVKTAVVTGCSSGIGAATARALRDAGWRVVPTARKDDDLARLRAEGFTPVRLDVSDEENTRAAAAEALAQLGGVVGALVNNAGFGQAGAVEDLSRAALRRQFEVNLIGMQDFANRFIPAMRRQGWGRIVNISSVLGRISLPFNGAYAATKFAMEALSDALRVELWSSGVGVILIEPGPIVSAFRRNAAANAAESLDTARAAFADYYRTEIARRAGQRKRPDLFTRPPEAVARVILRALESPRPRRRYAVTIPAHLGGFMARFAPTALLDRAMRRRLAAPRAASAADHDVPPIA